jgi:hypothetical protein
MTANTLFRPLLFTCFALTFVTFAQADVISNAVFNASGAADTTYYDGAFYDFSSSFPPASIALGSFTFAVPTGATITGATISGTFGNVDLNTTAPVDLFVDGGSIQVAACDVSGNNFPPCAVGTSDGSLVAWTYTFTSPELSALTSGSLDFTAVQSFFGGVNLGPATLDISVASPAPEPASFVSLGGGILGLLALRRRKA